MWAGSWEREKESERDWRELKLFVMWFINFFGGIFYGMWNIVSALLRIFFLHFNK
jgi:phage-related protein